MGYLTPDDAPSGTWGVVVYLPDHTAALFTLLGLLDTLSDPDNWTKYGDADPEDIAEVWRLANEDTATENLDTL